MQLRRGAFALAVIAGLGGCKQIIGYESPTTISAAMACSDGIKDFDETDVDCGGGTCPACADGERCTVGADCKDKVCTGGTCAAPTCSDKIKNGEETGIDCGGPTCPKCNAGQGCLVASDCVSATCTGMLCQSSCTDNVKDGNETDVDCGGGACPPCALGKVCKTNVDCESGVCTGGMCVDFVEWAQRMGSVGPTDFAMLAGLGLDGSGRVVIAANFMGQANFGGSTTYDTMGSEAFAFGRYDGMGNHLWDAGFVSGNQLDDQTVGLVAAGAAGGFVAVGSYESSGIDFGSGVALPGVAPAPIDTFSVTFGASDAVMSAHEYGNATGVNALAFGGLATDSFGTSVIVAGGGQWGTWALDTTTIHNDDLFVVDASSHLGSTYNDGGDPDGFVGVVTDADNNVFAAGQHHGTLNLGGGPVNSATAGEGFVLALDASFGHRWDVSFAALPDALAIDPAGDVIVCGEFSGSVDFGLGPLTSATGAVFVAELGSSGTAIWNEAFPISNVTSNVNSLVTTDEAGDVLLGVNAPGATIDFGGGSLSASFFVAKLDPAGSHVWSMDFGVNKRDRVVGIAAYNANEILLGGTFQGMLQLSTKSVSSNGTSDVFLAKLSLP